MMPSPRSALLCFLILLATPALADDGFGVIRGTVLNSVDLGTLEGVFVTATSDHLMGERTVVTDENGFYWFPQLPPGIYLLRFEFESFQPEVRSVLVRLNQTYQMNVDLLPVNCCCDMVFIGGSVSVPWGVRKSASSRTPPP